MPRGRHRHSQPLHRLLTPSTVAGATLATAAAAWLVADPVALRLLVALSAAGAVTAAVVMRGWDRAAGRRVAELTRERARQDWRHEERIAELESEIEEARHLRAKLETKLRAKRVELAGLRGEHAALLRRYATAETERASALEKRRLLATAATIASAPKELTAATEARTPRELPAPSEERTPSGAPTAVGYARANLVLNNLARQAAARNVPRQAATAVPAPIVPYPAPSGRGTTRVMGGFDFFGTKSAGGSPAAIESVQNEDLADVVGVEALAVHKEHSSAPEFKAMAAHHRSIGQVVDLTEHDETEPIDVGRLRTAIS
ncbi:coiled-coil domain-containing protein [Streptomyces sp. NPDC006879]|uniref:coiled-coil domain-containing protein n=1 Tax=Streptomyces sp. NPDC006879 TaxID=3364767 RepID=UPI0036A5E2B0